MIKYEEIAFTAYAVTNMSRARRFYEGVLGLKVARKFAKNFIEYDIGPGTLVVASAPDKWKPSPKGTSAALEVQDFEAAVKHLEKRKIKFVIGPAEYPMCSMLGIRDPDKNLIVLHKRKTTAQQGRK